MQYRRLGRTGLKVSEVSLGSWLTFGESVDEEVARRCIETAYDEGINFFDTANVYARGRAEEVVGRALARYPRSSYVLASKVYFPMGEGPNDRGLSRKHILEQCEASLKRLGTDYLDIYYCHRFDEETPLDETLRALDDLVTQGKVHYIGVSQWTAAQITDAVRTADILHLDPIAVNQPYYNLLIRDLEKEILPTCERFGIGIVPFSPLAEGVLTGKYRPGEKPTEGRARDLSVSRRLERLWSDEVLRRVESLRPIAERNELTMAQLALAWLLSRPQVSSVLTGASRPEHVKENAAASGRLLPADDLEEIDRLLLAE